jgi:hypothetical protein
MVAPPQKHIAFPATVNPFIKGIKRDGIKEIGSRTVWPRLQIYV